MRLELEEVFQICGILYIVSIFSSFCISNIFNLIDKKLLEIEDINLQRFAFVAVLFCQLLLTVFVYLFLDIFLFHIKSIRSFFRKNKVSLGELHSAEYCIHIILILVLIEMNESLMYEIDYIRKFMIVS